MGYGFLGDEGETAGVLDVFCEGFLWCSMRRFVRGGGSKGLQWLRVVVESKAVVALTSVRFRGFGW